MHSSEKIKILFLPRYASLRGSSRVRVYDYLPHLEKMGFKCYVLPFPFHLTLWSKIQYFAKALWLSKWVDVVVLQKLVLRESFIDWLKRVNPSLIFDFDDAIYAVPDAYADDKKLQEQYAIRRNRLNYILRKVKGVIVGSRYLYNYASQFASEVYVLPSSCDLKRYTIKNAEGKNNEIVFGWIGSDENLIDFNAVGKVLPKAFKSMPEKNVILKIISSDYASLNKYFPCKDIPLRWQKWEMSREIELLHSFNVGLVPLNDTLRSRGRCGFKAIQYMAVGLPVIASSVGALPEIIEHKETGFLAKTPEDWIEYLMELAKNKELRKKMGLSARLRVEKLYSIQANAPKFAEILNKLKK